MPVSRCFPCFPVGNSSDFCFHNLLILNCFNFYTKCAFVIKHMKNVIKTLYSVIINLLGVNLL